ncbi:MAG: sigma 54-interacting transcriptional regulator [Planctomycetes bacterium]|nr:sigma 54-interacting transcriptional regulator [Planctomycetota bacterium]
MNLEAMKSVMLAIADAQDSTRVLDEIVEGIAQCRNVVLARIWLLKEDAARTPNRWLQLAASAGNPADDGVDPKHLEGRFARFEFGERKIGRVAATQTGIWLADISRDENWIMRPDWAAKEGVRSFAAQPMIARGRLLGVLGVFDRLAIDADSYDWLRTFADHAAVALSNAAAFEEIDALKRRLERDLAYLREEAGERVGDILGSSPAIDKVRRQVQLVAATEASVLILGESGVGKELVARAVHEQSPRAARPLVKVNCSAIPDELFESEFFGHVKGAFTGAARDRTGRFELADGGTILLDEVGEIPLNHQAKLLRVLQEGSFDRVGDETTRQTDVRVIASTNRDLESEVKAGRFRADLYYRLGVFPITVPPLRERRHDLRALAAHFVVRSAQRLRVPPPRVTESEWCRLEAYDWPGNVRELEHVVERSLILSRRGPLHFEGIDAVGTTRPLPRADTEALPSLAQLKVLEREVIRRAWEAAGYRVSGAGGAAEQLGLPASTLESKLRAWGLK